MRKASGVALVLVGVIGLTLCCIVLLRLPFPIPGFLLPLLRIFSIFIDPLEAPIWSVLFLTSGIIILLWRPRAASSSLRSRLLFTLGLIVVVAIILCAGWYLLEKRSHEKRETLYAATLRSYSGILRAGMTRNEVEDYLRAKNILFMRMCCVEGKKNRDVFDDLTRIGHEKAPWYCSENNIYVAFQFVGSERHTVGPTAEDSDTLTKVTLFPWLEGCL